MGGAMEGDNWDVLGGATRRVVVVGSAHVDKNRVRWVAMVQKSGRQVPIIEVTERVATILEVAIGHYGKEWLLRSNVDQKA